MVTVQAPPRPPLTLTQVLICGALVVTLSMGIRHGFGLWLQPMTLDRQWSRETFSFALAVQNLAWGLAGPIAGVVADRFGAMRVLVIGGLMYAAGLAGMAWATTGMQLALTAGVLLGVSQSATTYAVIYGVIARNISPEKRSWAMGMTAAAGSFGQFLMVPVENSLISNLGWQQALFVLSASALLLIPLAMGLNDKPTQHSGPKQSITAALQEAFSHRSFLWLMAGYFVCGFQVVFIGLHMPSYLRDKGLGPEVATTALALIGLFNVVGTYGAGVLGSKFSKPRILSAIYLLRSVVIGVFLAAPLSPWSVYLFAAAMGLLWLSTVPPTNATVAQIFGVQYMSMLGGFVFLSHQIGSFLGAWLGGRLYGLHGSYDTVWAICIALGVFAFLANLPVRETPITRSAPQPA
jgi:MFS family permease